MLLAMFIIGAVIGNLTLLGFMALSEEAADTYGILISYPDQYRQFQFREILGSVHRPCGIGRHSRCRICS